MLIQETSGLRSCSVLNFLHPEGAREIEPGIYELEHFGSTDFLAGYEHDPELSVSAYGVFDSAEQLLTACPELKADATRKFVVTLTCITRAHQPASGGWRWHKWGPYIGTHKPQQEYLYDETGIEEVWVYHIYERMDDNEAPIMSDETAQKENLGNILRLAKEHMAKAKTEAVEACDFDTSLRIASNEARVDAYFLERGVEAKRSTLN